MDKVATLRPGTDTGIKLSKGWRCSLLVASAWVASVRVVITLYLALVSMLFPVEGLQHYYAFTGIRLLDSGWEKSLLGVWQREDALWYQKIATEGYSASDMTVQFFPLFPMLVRFISSITGLHPVGAGILISEVSLLVAFTILHRMVYSEYGLGVANRTLTYMSLYPSAFFLHGPFTESLVLSLVILAFFLISRERWIAAVLAAYLVGLGRPQGMVLGLPLVLHHFTGSQRVNQSASVSLRGKLFPVLPLIVAPVLGLATFLAVVDTPWRSPGTPANVGPMTHQWLAVPGLSMLHAGRRILDGIAYTVEAYDLVLAVMFLILVAYCFLRLGYGYAFYAALCVALPLARFSPVMPLMSFSRYILLAFPCFIVLAMWGRNRKFHHAYLVTGQLLMFYWITAYYFGAFVA